MGHPSDVAASSPSKGQRILHAFLGMIMRRIENIKIRLLHRLPANSRAKQTTPNESEEEQGHQHEKTEPK